MDFTVTRYGFYVSCNATLKAQGPDLTPKLGKIVLQQPHPELSGCITTLTVQKFCVSMDTLIDQDATISA